MLSKSARPCALFALQWCLDTQRGLSKEVCFYAGADWLKLIREPEDDRRFLKINGLCCVTRECCVPVWPSGKRKDLGSITLRQSFLLKKKRQEKKVVCGHCLVTLSISSY